MPKKDDDTLKQLMRETQKEIIHDWLQDQYAAFGRFTLRGIKTAIFAIIIWVVQHFMTIGIHSYSETINDQASNIIHK